jgi:hypothetical protein
VRSTLGRTHGNFLDISSYRPPKIRRMVTVITERRLRATTLASVETVVVGSGHGP